MDGREKNNEVEEIDLRQILFALLDKWLLIVLAGVLFAAGAFVITQFFITPKYTSNTSFYVISRSENTPLTSSDVSVSTSLTADFGILVKSRTVLEQVIEEVGLNIDTGTLAKQITVSNQSGTRILQISVVDEDAYQAKLIADAVAAISSGQIMALMGIEQVNIIDVGNIPTSPSSPSLIRNVAIAGAAGVLLAMVIILLIFLFDDTIKTGDDVEKYLGTSVLGMIPLSENELASGKPKKKRKKSGGSRAPARTAKEDT